MLRTYLYYLCPCAKQSLSTRNDLTSKDEDWGIGIEIEDEKLRKDDISSSTSTSSSATNIPGTISPLTPLKKQS